MADDFASVFGRLGQAQSRTAFEVRFNQIQRTFLQRANKEIEEATNDGTAERLGELDQRRQEIAEYADRAREYRFGLETNEARFREIAVSTFDAIDPIDGNTSLTADEADTLNAYRDEVVENIKKLKLLRFPDFSDGEVTSRLLQHVEDLEALTAEAGTVDDADADPQTNDNRALIDLMTTINSDSLVFADTTSTIVGAVNGFLIDAQSDQFAIEAEATELTRVQAERNTEKADEIKAKYGNLLKAISLSFEGKPQITIDWPEPLW